MQQSVGDFGVIRFSAHALPERDRVGQWREFFGPNVFGATVAPAPDHPFRADLCVRRLSGSNVLSAVCSPARFSRTRAFLADGRADFGLHIYSGRSVVVQRGRELACAPGDPILVCTGEPAATVTSDLSSFLCVHVDRSLIDPLVAHADDRVLRRVPARDPILRYLLEYLRFLEEAPMDPANASVGALASGHVRDLVALLFGATGEAAELAERGGLRSARRAAIRRFVHDNLADPALCVDMVASRHGMSARSVQRMFERDGTTFSQYVLNARLDRACRLLGDPAKAASTVTDIALESGFGDISYFNRRFRRRFGGPPRAFRDDAAGRGAADR